MTIPLYFPADELGGQTKDFDLAADYVELSSFFSSDGIARLSDLINASEIGADSEYASVDDEITSREEIVAGATNVIEARRSSLAEAYPFQLSDDGRELALQQDLNIAGGAYLLCLIISNLESVSPILSQSGVHPSTQEVNELRQYFQYLATAAMAGEICGKAWSFGFPRPDGTGFIQKLREIWRHLGDGDVFDGGAAGAPTYPKDDQIDVFAIRDHSDGLPGYLLAAAQVATGANWKAKSVVAHVNRVFYARWFLPQPVTKAVAYHVIPFARKKEDFQDDVLVVGNLLHRTRVPRRVSEAIQLSRDGVAIEAIERLENALAWVTDYRTTQLEAAA